MADKKQKTKPKKSQTKPNKQNTPPKKPNQNKTIKTKKVTQYKEKLFPVKLVPWYAKSISQLFKYMPSYTTH